MKKLCAILLCLCQPSAWAAVAWNANSSASTDSGNGAASPQTNTTMTVGASSTALLCLVSFNSTFAAPGVVTVNWDSTASNQAMTLIGSKDNSTATASVAFYGLVNPTTGNKTFRVAWTVGTAEVITWCSDFTGTATTSVAAAFINFTSGVATSTNPNITITSNVGDVTVDGGNESAQPPPTTPTRTQIFSISGAGASNPWASRSTGGSPNVAHSWTIASVAWAEIGVDITVPAAGAAAVCSSPFCGFLQ